MPQEACAGRERHPARSLLTRCSKLPPLRDDPGSLRNCSRPTSAPDANIMAMCCEARQCSFGKSISSLSLAYATRGILSVACSNVIIALVGGWSEATRANGVS